MTRIVCLRVKSHSPTFSEIIPNWNPFTGRKIESLLDFALSDHWSNNHVITKHILIFVIFNLFHFFCSLKKFIHYWWVINYAGKYLPRLPTTWLFELVYQDWCFRPSKSQYNQQESNAFDKGEHSFWEHIYLGSIGSYFLNKKCKL